MSYSTIYFIGLTVVFAIYYLALMYLDMKAKKEDKSDVETIDLDGERVIIDTKRRCTRLMCCSLISILLQPCI